MTRALLIKHLLAWDDGLICDNQPPVLLIVDNVSTHHGSSGKCSNLAEEIGLKKIHIRYLSPSSTSTLQIMDVGINHVVKAAYRLRYSFEVLTTLTSNVQVERKTKERFAEHLFHALNQVKTEMVINTVRHVFGDRILYDELGKPSINPSFIARISLPNR